jgi:hypothetical protein
MSPAGRNGANSAYSALFVVAGLAVFAAIGCATAAAVSVAKRLVLARTTTQTLGVMAVALVGAMAVTLVSLVAWWATEAAQSPGFLAQTIGNGAPYASSVVPPTLVACGLLMTAGLALGLAGLVRIVGALGAGGRTLA